MEKQASVWSLSPRKKSDDLFDMWREVRRAFPSLQTEVNSDYVAEWSDQSGELESPVLRSGRVSGHDALYP